MPSWGLHLYIAKCVNEKLKKRLELNDFIFGNVLPDMYSGWIVKNVSKKYEYDYSHYAKEFLLNSGVYKLSNYEEFIEEQRKNLDNVIVLGYLSHLIADHYFNKYAFSHHYIKNSYGHVTNIILNDGNILDATSEIARIYKQNDTAIFSNYILKNECKNLAISLNNNIINDVKNFKRLDINKNDLILVDKYLKNIIDNGYEDILQAENEYKMFTKEELYKLTSEIIDNIVKIIDKINF